MLSQLLVLSKITRSAVQCGSTRLNRSSGKFTLHFFQAMYIFTVLTEIFLALLFLSHMHTQTQNPLELTQRTSIIKGSVSQSLSITPNSIETTAPILT